MFDEAYLIGSEAEALQKKLDECREIFDQTGETIQQRHGNVSARHIWQSRKHLRIKSGRKIS